MKDEIIAEICQINLDISFSILLNEQEKLEELHKRKSKLLKQLAIHNSKKICNIEK